MCRPVRDCKKENKIMYSDESEYLKETARSYAAKKEDEIFT